MGNRKHPSHITRSSDASTFDEICVNCGAHDQVPGGWGDLEYPCPNAHTASADKVLSAFASKVQKDNHVPMFEQFWEENKDYFYMNAGREEVETTWDGAIRAAIQCLQNVQSSYDVANEALNAVSENLEKLIINDR